MRFANIRLYYDASSALDLPVDDLAQSSPYVVKKIDGLDPPDINPIITENMHGDGSYQTSHPVNREIVILLGYRPNYSAGETVSDLRDRLYDMISPRSRSPLKVAIQDKARVTRMTTEGVIKRVEANPFSKDPEIQITIRCTGPYFKRWGIVQPNPGSLPKDVIPIMNEGNAPSGFSMRLTFTGVVEDFRLIDESGSKFEVFYKFSAGNVFTLDTTPGQRRVFTTGMSLSGNLLFYLNPYSDWLQLNKGLNRLTTNKQNFTLNELIVNSNFWGV